MLLLNFIFSFVLFSVFIVPCHSSADDEKISAVEYGLHSKKIDNAYDNGRTVENVDTRHKIGDLSNLADKHLTDDVEAAGAVSNNLPESGGGVVMGGNTVVKAPTLTGSLYSSTMNGGK
uniref:Uncharacterized protein n=1 Tax=Panagrolaimus sp. PS1159 TaxID=55785 RepID=A0AC35FU29_9BILA